MLKSKVASVSICLLAFVAISFLPAKFGPGSQSVKAQQTFTISVQINDGSFNGPPISGVSVLLVMNGSTQFTAQTDANGTCAFTGISGSYEVTPSKPNYDFNPVSQGGSNTGPRTLFFTGSTSAPSSSVSFSALAYSASEGAGRVALTVNRNGSTSNAASVTYSTSDTAALTNCNVTNGIASSRCDYAVSVGTINFAAGETSKSLSIPIVDDSYAEGNESFSATLSKPVGTTLGSPGTTTTVTINDNETSNGPNPIDQTAFFVRQHYIDFLGREPDPAGFQDWQNTINNCPAGNTTCDRIHVSGNFFQSPEFQQRGYFVYRFYPVAIGRKPDYAEFIPDLASVSGFLTDAQLEAAKVAFVIDFMARPGFAQYNGMSNTQYVDTLLLNAGITHPARNFWIAALGNGSRTRAQVLREIADSNEVNIKYFNQAFVVMQYFGYLRRDPDAFYLDWIQVLNSSNDSRGMITGFVNSAEYRLRFGP
jgi:Calx-beta domain-containing protein/uncharacterized protein DUF4214